MTALSLAYERPDRVSVGELLRRTILAALRDIEAALDAPSPSPREIHLARRAAKRVRALARLAPERLSVLARQSIKGVGDARRGFGGARDADVRCATLDGMRGALTDDAHAVLRRLATDRAAGEFSADRQAARATIVALVRDWTLCNAEADGAAIAASATNAYRRSRRRMERATSGGSSDLHRWRSAVVDHEHHADFLSAFAPAMREESDSADQLRRRLGDLHDLDALTEYFHDRRAKNHDAADAVRRLQQIVVVRRARLAGKALRLGADIYERGPKKWRATLMQAFARETGSQDQPR